MEKSEESLLMRYFSGIFVTLIFLLSWMYALLLAEQNENAAIRIDFDYLTSGNQNQDSMDPPGTGVTVWLEIHVSGASNLDTYEFDLNYFSSDLTFISAFEDNPFSSENNFLKKNGGSTTGWGATDYTTHINVRNTLVGNQGEDTPDGSGLLAVLNFTTKVDAPGNLNFGTVKWLDNDGVQDLGTDKGDASLPIELASFEASCRGEEIVLKWVTESEINNEGFEIFKSEDEQSGNYVLISSYRTNEGLRGQGNSTTRHQYFYIDREILPEQIYWYKLADVDFNRNRTFHGPINASLSSTNIPKEFKLYSNFPNPFNPSTTIKFDLPKTAEVTLKIFSILGEEVATLVSEQLSAGNYQYQWSRPDGMASGIYIYRLSVSSLTTKKVHSAAGETEEYVKTRKMLLMR